MPAFTSAPVLVRVHVRLSWMEIGVGVALLAGIGGLNALFLSRIAASANGFVFPSQGFNPLGIGIVPWIGLAMSGLAGLILLGFAILAATKFQNKPGSTTLPINTKDTDSMDLLLKDLEPVPGGPFSSLMPHKDATLDHKWRLFEKRLDYAQKFFDHHAKQRMSMFNFFLIFVGFILTAYSTSLKDCNRFVSSFIGGVGVVLTVVFLFLERRNEELVHIAEDVLEGLETDVLFRGYEREISWPRRRKLWSGKMKKGDAPQLVQLGIFLRQSQDIKALYEGKPLGRSIYEHGKWLPWFHVVMIIIFLALAIVSQTIPLTCGA